MAKRGAKVKSNTITIYFNKSRDKANIDWGEETPATYHEKDHYLKDFIKNKVSIKQYHEVIKPRTKQTDTMTKKGWILVRINQR